MYTVVGATYGRPALVHTDRPFCVQRHIAILKPVSEIDFGYLHLLLSSPLIYEQATRSLTGTAQPTIPLRPLRNFLAPLPPLAEQHRIVAKVAALMALCDQLEAQLVSTDGDNGRLLEAVLHEALTTEALATAA
ncbi:restriction endonuclease subunit S [Burkholderia pyrrocinia]|uniref:restriction endonuclease subunit S n=1 Tax=Burkholderia pyrrocinia TaxID=60550 RepID=UPI00215AC2EF|nr:restriction endonuclease subunit S [Burkholderia pyrrocinia]UVE66902.1 restriction endonuclease subunit S [Burkholderia pyrrocinia]